MNELEKIFQLEGKELRTIVDPEGEPMFCGKDACEMLELPYTSKALGRVDEEDKGVILIHTLGGMQKMLFVNESGLYSLIMSSRKAAAKSFKRWVTHEVLPSIRRTGMYAREDFSLIKVLERALVAARENEQKTVLLAVQQPKVDFCDLVFDTGDTFTLGETAKMLKFKEIGPNTLMRKLREWGVLMAGNVAKQKYIDRGYFTLIQQEYYMPDGVLRVRPTTRVLQKGVDYIRRLLLAEQGKAS